MVRWLLAGIAPSVICLSAFSANAVTLRYALIIGNNVGVDANGKEPFPPLLHAQREAERLRSQLVKRTGHQENGSGPEY